VHKENTDTKTTTFAALLSAGGPVVIDGGLATQCEAMGCNIDGKLWSGVLLRDDPLSIVAANRAYLDAGAQIITTASYQASRHGFMLEGATAEEADRLIQSSVTLARQARDEFLRDNPGAETPLIAASIGPYGAALHDGSEYTGDYDISADELRQFHLERLELLDTSDIDLLACETIPSAAETLVLSELLRDAHNSSWISFSCRDATHLADGTPLIEAAGLFAEHPRVLAVGVNCVPPDMVVPLIATLREAAPEKSIVVYPNSGEVYRVEDNTWVGTATPLQCEHAANDWVRAGATIVGGCCRIGPGQIAAMAQSVNNRR
jgi:homocysteine S-methyltransferase